MGLFRKHIIWTNIIFISAEMILASLAWFSGEWFFAGSVQTFGSLHSYSFIWLAIIIATIAALNSIFTTTIASETQRPLLARSGKHILAVKQGDYVIIPFVIENFGTIPARAVEVDIDFFGEGEEIKEDNKSNRWQPSNKLSHQSMVFPHNSFTEQYILDLRNGNDSELSKQIEAGKGAVRVRIQYTGLDKRHITIQTERTSKREWEEKVLFEAIPPQVYK